MSAYEATSRLNLADIATDLAGLVRELQQGARHEIQRDDLSSAFGSIAKILSSIYASGVESPLNPDYFTVTEAVITIQYLMEAHNVNNFDLAMWSSRAKIGN